MQQEKTKLEVELEEMQREKTKLEVDLGILQGELYRSVVHLCQRLLKIMHCLKWFSVLTCMQAPFSAQLTLQSCMRTVCIPTLN